MSTKKELSPKQRDELLAALKARFDAGEQQQRHGESGGRRGVLPVGVSVN